MMRLAPVLATALVLLAGCGSDGESRRSTDAAPPTPLDCERVELQDALEPASPEQLTGTIWTHVALDGCLREPVRHEQPDLVFASGGELQYFDGCNVAQGRWRIDEGRIVVEDVETTSIACAPSAAIDDVAAWRLAADGRLFGLDADGAALVTSRPARTQDLAARCTAGFRERGERHPSIERQCRRAARIGALDATGIPSGCVVELGGGAIEIRAPGRDGCVAPGRIRAGAEPGPAPER